MAKIYSLNELRTIVSNLNAEVAVAADFYRGAISNESQKSQAHRNATRLLEDEIALRLAAALKEEPLFSTKKSTKEFDVTLAGERVKITRLPELAELTRAEAEAYKEWQAGKMELERSKVAFDAAKVKAKQMTAALSLDED